MRASNLRAEAPAAPADDVTNAGQQPRQLLGASAQLRHLCERVVANQDFARRGRRLAEQGMLALGPFKEVPVGSFDWQADPLGNRSWQWRFNWLSFLSFLIAHHHASGDGEAIRMAARAALSWLRHFGPPARRHPFEFAWHDHATALRAEQLALLVHYVQTRSLVDLVTPQELEALAEGCVQHAELLHRDDFFSRHTNHGLEQARVLLLLGSALATGPDSPPAAWRSRALERIDAELHHAFTDEGVHVENSPSYHVFVFKVFLGIVGDYASESLGPLRTWMKETAPKALTYLTHVIRPDGRLPIIGDTEGAPVSDSFRAAFEGLPQYEELSYVLSAGRRGTRPAQLNRVFPASGYAIFRGEWPDAAGFDRPLHLVFKAGALSKYHRQQDDGNVVVYHEGEDWLIDSGMFNYEKGSPIRRYVRSRAAHNVVSLDRPFADAAEPAGTWRILACSEDEGLPFVTARSTVHPGVHAVRRVSMARRRTFRVEDTLVATDGQPFDAAFLWHVPADKQVEVLGPGEVLVKSTRSRRAMRIRTQGDLLDSIDCRAGVVGRTVWSVVSQVANDYKPSQVLVFSAARRDSLYVQFDFSFESQR